MTHLELYNATCQQISRLTTLNYSTSFSMGIKALSKEFHFPIFSIYGFVRFADEIVDTFHDYQQEEMILDFEAQTFKAINDKISTNPILHSFQLVVNKYKIEKDLIDTFLNSMKMDLNKTNYTKNQYEEYILGSAEVVGLMCLRVFTQGDDNEYGKLKKSAMSLGSAFQKVNFLRDLSHDANNLGRIYFPNLDLKKFDQETKNELINEIKSDFKNALKGIKLLDNKDVNTLLNKRIRIANSIKILTSVKAYSKFKLKNV